MILGHAADIAFIIVLSSLFLPNTLNSLIEHNHKEESHTMLQKIRDTNYIQAEFDDIKAASEESKTLKQPWCNIIQHRYCP